MKSPGRISEISVALFDIDQAEDVASEWKIITRDRVRSWKEVNQAFMEIIKVQDFTRYFITITILIVASFGIYNVLSIMINQKKREIAILRSIGYGPQKILQLVLYQGLVLGIGGGIIGLISGFILCKIIGNIDFNIQIGGSNHLIMSYDWDIYVTGMFAALVSSIIASYIPALSASRLTPIDIIRSEA
jgi:lipoprotein-releasing system permease protein